MNATPARRAQLKAAPAQVPDWYTLATAQQQLALNEKFTTSFSQQTVLDKAMARLQSIDAFAEPLLVKLGDVTPEKLETARDSVRKLDGSSAEFNALLGRKFWKDFVVAKYELQFTEMRDPYFEQIAQLEEANDAGRLNSGDFLAQSNAVMRRVAAAEEALIERYSRTEWEAYIAAPN